MPITIGLNLEREEYDELAGILKMNGKRVSPTLTNCLRKEADALRGKTSEMLKSSDAEDVRTDVHTEKKSRKTDAPRGGKAGR